MNVMKIIVCGYFFKIWSYPNIGVSKLADCPFYELIWSKQNPYHEVL